MITLENYIEDIKRYKVTIPDGFKSSDAMMHEYHNEFEKYGENEAVRETKPTAEKYVKLLNTWLVKNGFEFKKKKDIVVKHKFKVGQIVLLRGKPNIVDELKEDGTYLVHLSDSMVGRKVQERIQESYLEAIKDQKASLNKNEFVKDDIIIDTEKALRYLEQNKAPYRLIEFNSENWKDEFGVFGIVKTPIGNVEISYEQYHKIVELQRDEIFGLIKPTLENPLLIVNSIDSNGNKRKSFIKTFESVTVVFMASFVKGGKNKLEVVSNHERRESQIKKILSVGSEVCFIPTEVGSIRPSGSLGTTNAPHPHDKTFIISLSLKLLNKDSKITNNNKTTTQKVVKEPKAKTAKLTSHTPAKKVEKIPFEVSIFAQYIKLHNKDVDVAKVEALIRRIKKGITEGEIKKSTPYKKEFNEMANDIVKTLNSLPINKQIVSYEVPTKLLAELKEITSDIGLLSSVVLIKKYLTEYGRENNDKIKKLIELTTKKLASGEVPKTDVHIKELRELKKYSEDYLQSGQWQISQEQLNGLGSIGGLGRIDKIEPKSTVIAPNKVMQTSEFVKSIFAQMPFKGKWKAFFGCPTPPFRGMLWGMPGNGKSTLALQLAHYIASDMNKRTLYVANEEGLGATLKEKVERLNVTHHNLFLTEELPSKLSNYDALFIDSANHAMLEPEDVNEIAKKHPHLSIITVNQCTKDGSFRGSNVWEHDVDFSIKCVKGIAENVKNRFGGTGTFKCF